MGGLNQLFNENNSALIGQLTGARAALLTVSQVSALLFSASSWFQLYRKYWHKSCTCVTWRRSVMSASHGIKGKTSDQAFRAVSYNLYKRKQTKMHYKINLRSIIDTFSSMLSHSARNITVLVHLSPSPSVVFSHSRQKLSEKSLWMKNLLYTTGSAPSWNTEWRIMWLHIS